MSFSVSLFHPFAKFFADSREFGGLSVSCVVFFFTPGMVLPIFFPLLDFHPLVNWFPFTVTSN